MRHGRCWQCTELEGPASMAHGGKAGGGFGSVQCDVALKGVLGSVSAARGSGVPPLLVALQAAAGNDNLAELVDSMDMQLVQELGCLFLGDA
jgi:hypothetical protein